MSNGYPTVADILVTPAARLTRLPGFGRGTLLRIQRELAALGHNWDVPEVLLDLPVNDTVHHPPGSDEAGVATFDLTPRTVNSLYRGGYWTAGQVRDASDADLMAIRNLVPGDELVSVVPKWSHGRGVLTEDGRINVDGVLVATPTEAETMVTGLSASRGWNFWGLKRDGQVVALTEVRDGFERISSAE